MVSIQKPPTKQHTIPKFYLKRFSDSNLCVWAYDRVSKELRKQPSKDTTIERDFYTFNIKKGKKSYAIETDILAQNIEKRADIVMAKLEQGQLPTTIDDRRDLCEFVTMQYLRTTAFRRDANYLYEQFSKIMLRMSFGDMEKAKRTIAGYEKHTGEKLGLTPEEGIKFVKDDNYSIDVPKEYALRLMLDSFKEFYGIFFRMNWVFVKSPNNKLFITSDNPFTVLRFDAKPFVPYHISHAELTLPLTPHTCLYMNEYGGATYWQEGRDKEIDNFNCRTAISSDRYVISRKRKQLIQLVKISNLDKIPRQAAVKISSPF